MRAGLRDSVWIRFAALAARVGVPIDVLLEMDVRAAERRLAS